MAPAVIDRVVDGFVTPQALVRLLAEKPSSEQPALSLARAGFTDFDEYMLLLGSSAPTRPRMRAILRRDGITWRALSSSERSRSQIARNASAVALSVRFSGRLSSHVR